MAKVIIAFSRDHAQVGKIVEVPDDDAAVMVSEGRARYADDDAKTSSRRTGKQSTGSTK